MKKDKKYKIIEQSRFLNSEELGGVKGGSDEICVMDKYFKCASAHIVYCKSEHGECFGFTIQPCDTVLVECSTYNVVCAFEYSLCGFLRPYNYPPCPTKLFF